MSPKVDPNEEMIGLSLSCVRKHEPLPGGVDFTIEDAFLIRALDPLRYSFTFNLLFGSDKASLDVIEHPKRVGRWTLISASMAITD